MEVGATRVSHQPLLFGFFLLLCALLGLLVSLHLLHLQEDVVRQLRAAVRRHMSALSDEEMIDVHQPDFAKLILIEIDFHFE